MSWFHFKLLCLATIYIDTLLCKTPFEYVDPHIGTSGNGYGTGGIPLGAQIPFGSIRLGADTCQYGEEWSPWEHTGGYYYKDHFIRMLSHTHLVGAGVADYGAVGMLPISELPARIGKTDFNRFPWMQPFSHEMETSQPGYYSIYLPSNGIRIELTATLDVGLHRYSFTNSSLPRYILFDTAYTLQYDACQNSSFLINFTNNEVTGHIHESGALSSRFGGVYIFYVVHFSATFNVHNFGTWKNGKICKYNGVNQTTFAMAGNDIGFWLQFENDAVVEMYVALSFISLEQAMKNLQHDLDINVDSEKGDSLFDAIKNQTQTLWKKHLNLVEINNINYSYITDDNLTVFYTALYHTFLAPTKFSEAGGNYKGFDLNVHTLTDPNRGYYTDISGWDVFRSEFPWLALIRPNIMADIIQSLVYMFEEGGDLPRWPLGNGYTNCMIGTHANIMIADAVAHNLSHLFDLDTAYQGMYQSATKPQQHAARTDISDYIELGYVPYESTSEGACHTLAYCYDDWAVANVAKHLNKTSDYAMFLNRSNFYKNVWSKDKQFMCPRNKNGTLLCPMDPLSLTNGKYIEGNAWHYRFFVPHDVSGLISLFKDTTYYVQQLTQFFDRSFVDPYNFMPNPYYWAGNEEDLFSVWQFAFPPANRQDLTAKYSRKLLQLKYPNTAEGVPGNDDYGTMSAWAVFAFLGFYPRSGDGSYVLGSPFFNDVILHREKGDIHIKVYNGSASNVYIVNCSVNGKVVELKQEPFLYIADIMNGAQIQFWMSDTPL